MRVKKLKIFIFQKAQLFQLNLVPVRAYEMCHPGHKKATWRRLVAPAAVVRKPETTCV